MGEDLTAVLLALGHTQQHKALSMCCLRSAPPEQVAVPEHYTHSEQGLVTWTCTGSAETKAHSRSVDPQKNCSNSLIIH